MQSRFGFRLVLLALILFFLPSVAPAANFDDPDFQAAVAAASGPLTEARLEDDLWALNPDYTSHPLQFDEQGRVLLVTWTGGEYYDDYVGQEYVIPDFAEVWFVPVPQVKRFFQEPGRTFSVERLEQAYGLPPESGYDRMVTLWVNPGDLARPCPDPAVSDTMCETDFPEGQYVTIDQAYKDWFTQRRGEVYDCSQGLCYPWTGLGYTYDWGPDPAANHVGFSEYIKPKGLAATVLIQAVTPTAQYFSKGMAPEYLLLLKAPGN